MIQNRMSKQIATDAKISLIGERLEMLADEFNLPPLDGNGKGKGRTD
jgi:hypothetical protein